MIFYSNGRSLAALKLDASAYPTVVAINQRLQALPAFAASHPLQQPGAPR